MFPKRRGWSVAGGLVLALCSPAVGLERIEDRAPHRDRYESTTGGLETIAYSNTCTDLTWRWSLGAGAAVGVIFESESIATPTLLSTTLYMAGITYAGWGYTGTITVHELDSQDCAVEPPLATQAFYPQQGFTEYVWNVATPSRFLVRAKVGDLGFFQPLSDFVTDHPGVGESAPAACGLCYPVDRVAHSRYFGSTSNPIPCGIPFFDGRCDAELLWDARLEGTTTSLQHSSWGSIKALYR